MSSAFAGLIASLSARINVELAIEDDVKVRADFDDFALLMEYLPGSDQVLLAASIAEVAAGNRLELYRDILQGQFIFRQTQGASLALDPAEKFICLQILQPLLALTKDNFPDLVENFLNLAEFWRGRCLSWAETSEDGQEAGQPSPAHPGVEFLRI
jgi:hypothetical protein